MPPRRFAPLTRDQVRAVDRITIEHFGMPGLLLMEHAAMALRQACDRFNRETGQLDRRGVAIVCGGGNNGGDGYALARLLANTGADVQIFAAKAIDDLDGDAAVNAKIARTMGLNVSPANADVIASLECGLLVDTLLGTGLTSSPREDASALINAMNQCSSPTLAVDLPSGLDCDVGIPLGDTCVRADFTVSFVAEKIGFAHASSWTGHVHVGDIGCPAEAVEMALREPAA